MMFKKRVLPKIARILPWAKNFTQNPSEFRRRSGMSVFLKII
jgi:hypothetical protein